MSKQHCQFSILLLLLICMYSICPILCASIGEKFCNLTDAFAETRHNDFSSSCCDRNETDETDIPSDHATSCCSTDMPFIISNDSHVGDNIGKAEGQQFASTIQFTVFLPNNRDILLSQHPTRTLTLLPFHSSVSRRGPPFTRS